MAAVVACDTDLEVDGELIGQRYVVYDILSKNGQDIRHLDYHNRHVMIPREFSPKHFGVGIEVAPLYTGEEYKRARFQEIQDACGEGVVFKRLGASFTVGRPSSGGDFLKFKFYATCSCIVVPSAGNRIGRRSVALALHPEAASFTLTPVGNCTIPNKKVAGELIPIPQHGDVIEVRYLYAYQGGSLYQPTYIGLRDDVDEYECQMSQLKYKAED